MGVRCSCLREAAIDEPSTPLSDTGFLLERARSGDERAWSELHRRYIPGLCATLKDTLGPHTGPGVNRDDILQSTFLSAWSSLPDFEYRGPGSLLGWLRMIALRKLQDDLRRELRRGLPSEREQRVGRTEMLNSRESEETGPLDSVARTEEHVRLLAALMTLDPVEREVVCQRMFECREWEEIARQVELTPQQARRAFSRALGILQERLAELDVSDGSD